MIKSIDSSKLRSNFKDALLYVNSTKAPLVIKHRNIATSVLVDIDEYEDYLFSKDKSFLKSIQKSRQDIKTGKVYSMDDVFGNILN